MTARTGGLRHAAWPGTRPAPRALAWLGVLCVVLAINLPVAARAQAWAGFYDRARLEQTRTDMAPGIEENLREVILPRLTADERQALAGVRLQFPLEHDASPMNFWALASGQVVLPVSSLRFLADICLAYAWLNAQGHDLQSVADYLAALKYRGPGAFGGASRQPLQALGIPAEARTDTRVQRDMQRLFGSAVVFILGHELGHVRHGHRASVSAEASRAQEREADAFALELMRRIGNAPLGTLPVFMVFAHLGSYASDTDHARLRTVATHPMSGERLRAAARQLDESAPDHARSGTSMAVLRRLASELRTVGQLLDDPGWQRLMRLKGQSVTLADLATGRPRGADAQQAGRGSADGVPPAFDGRYTGRWLDAKGQHLDVTMDLRREGTRVQGEYDFGAGRVQIDGVVDGVVDGERLHYRWRWGSDHFGRGILQPGPGGRGLRGTWGTTERSDGGGTWDLQRGR